MDFSGILSTTGYVIEVLIGVSLVIFVHELGHFMAAKWAGVRVRRFFFGFAPTIRIGKRKIRLLLFEIDYKGTKYGVGLLPFGGFVEMAGEQEGEGVEDVPVEEQFNSKTPGQRAVIFVAGAAMNAISAVLFFIIAFFIGVSFVKPIIGDVAEGGPAWKAGLQPGDRIMEIDGVKQEEFTELLMKIALADADKPLKMKIQRKDKIFVTDVTPISDPLGRGMTIGISTSAEPVIQHIEPDSPAKEAGLQVEDRIIGIEYSDPETGETVISEVESFLDLTRVIREPKMIGKLVTLKVEREGSPSPLSLKITPAVHKQSQKLIGIGPKMTTIAAIKNGSTASKLLKEGDIIESVSCEGKPYSLAGYEAEKPACDKITLQVNREFENVSLTVESNEFSKWLAGEIAFSSTIMRRDGKEYIESVIGSLQEGMPAILAGMKYGDRITNIDGVSVSSFSEVSQIIRSKQGKPIEVTWETKTETGEIVKKSAEMAPATQRIGYLGILPRQNRFTRTVRNPFKAVAIGWDRTIIWGKRVFLIIESLFTSKVSAKNLAGPVGIFTISYAVTQYGVGTLLYFLAMISINLAIINVFPVPVLDGGHLLFLGIEKIKGSPVSIKSQVIAQTVGLVLLLSMAIFVTINDISRLFTGF